MPLDVRKGLPFRNVDIDFAAKPPEAKPQNQFKSLSVSQRLTAHRRAKPEESKIEFYVAEWIAGKLGSEGFHRVAVR